jgi:hypothetical protein
MDALTFFTSPQNIAHKQYEALRAFFYEKKSAQEIAKQFGYTTATLYSLVRDFKKSIQLNGEIYKQFFIEPQRGRKPREDYDEIHDSIILLRKKYLSVPDIKSILDAQKKSVSEKQIYNILRADGFARLPRRTQSTQNETLSQVPITAPKSSVLENISDAFNTQYAGILCFLPYLQSYGIDQLIDSSAYPETKTLPRLNSILAFIALKLSNVRRYTADDLWCMDRGLGLFAGLNVLPKAAWYTSYSHRVTREMNLSFLKSLHALWMHSGLLSDTANLDFVAVPYFGDDTHLENNWSGTRHQALASILAAVVHDPDTGIMTYGDTNVRHEKEADIVIEFLDFYKQTGGKELKYLVFDSKFTVYENLRKLDDNGVKFITIRRRGKNIIHELDSKLSSEWKTVRVQISNGKSRQLKVIEQTFFLKGYNKFIRQISITGHGKIKPALIITNDFELDLKLIIRKYARRWLVEKTISEQTHFFHLNKVSSSMVIKVDFDLTMTILAHNLYRLMAADLTGYSHCTAQSLYEKFIHNSGIVEINDNSIAVSLKKKRNLPAILSAMNQYLPEKMNWLNNRDLNIKAATYS